MLIFKRNTIIPLQDSVTIVTEPLLKHYWVTDYFIIGWRKSQPTIKQRVAVATASQRLSQHSYFMPHELNMAVLFQLLQ